MAVDRRAVHHMHKILPGRLAQLHVQATGRDQRHAPLQPVAVFGFTHVHGANAVEAACVHGGEFFRHVLGDGNARCIGGKAREHQLQRLRAAGGAANHHRLVHGEGMHRTEHRWPVDHRPGHKRLGPAHSNPRPGLGGGFKGLNHLAARVFKVLLQAQLGLGQHRHRASGQRFQRHFAALGGKRGANDGGNGCAGHDLPQKRQPVHARHFNVQQQHIGRILADHVHGQEGIGRAADQLYLGVAREHVRQRLAHHGGVIDHKNFDDHLLFPALFCSVQAVLRNAPGMTVVIGVLQGTRPSAVPKKNKPPGLSAASTRSTTALLVGGSK